jgi:hypothetical protein
MVAVVPKQSGVVSVAVPKQSGVVSVAELITEAKARGLVVTGRSANISVKVSAKGALSVYGLGRFPVTLYASQWRALMANASKITDALTANKETLVEKGAADPAADPAE